MKLPTPFLVLYGNSVLLAGIKADLRGRTPLELVTIGADRADAEEQIHRLNPSVVVFDLGAAQPGFAVSLLQNHPDVLLLGLDPSNDEMLVLSGRPERALSVEDLVRISDAHLGKRVPTARRHRHFWSWFPARLAQSSRRRQFALAAVTACLVVLLGLSSLQFSSSSSLLGTAIGNDGGAQGGSSSGPSNDLNFIILGFVAGLGVGAAAVASWLRRRQNGGETRHSSAPRERGSVHLEQDRLQFTDNPNSTISERRLQ